MQIQRISGLGIKKQQQNSSINSNSTNNIKTMSKDSVSFGRGEMAEETFRLLKSLIELLDKTGGELKTKIGASEIVGHTKASKQISGGWDCVVSVKIGNKTAKYSCTVPTDRESAEIALGEYTGTRMDSFIKSVNYGMTNAQVNSWNGIVQRLANELLKASPKPKA